MWCVRVCMHCVMDVSCFKVGMRQVCVQQVLGHKQRHTETP